MARIGKIARLPDKVREELNQRMRGGQLGPQLLPWLNGVPEVQAVLSEFFSGAEINSQNLSDWRQGGYAEWEEKQDRHWQRLERIRELSSMSMKLAQANAGNLTEGAASILGGSILEVLEQIDDLKSLTAGAGAETDGEKLKAAAEAIDNLTNAVARLRRGDQDNVVLRQNEKRINQKDAELALAREKFEMAASEKMLDDALRRQAEEIAHSNMSNADKIAAMRRAAFSDVDALEASGEVRIPA